MQLFFSPASPFVRKVRVLLEETGQTDAVECVHATTSALNTSATPTPGNPLGKIPTLTRPGAPALFDSRVICRYLDHRAGGKLYPEARIWEVLTLEALADGILDAAVFIVYEGRNRPPELQSAECIAGQWAKVSRGLDALEAQWMSHLHGPLDAGQIAVGCALGYLDFRHGDRSWRDGRDSLTAWEKRFAARPSMQATRPDLA